jgi:hypothetical protein
MMLWALLIAYAALVTHDFYLHVNRWLYISVDDGLANEAYTLASQGRYGFLSSPVLFGIDRHHGEFSYGPWYFYLAGALIWLFGYSLTLVRSIHLWVILGSIVAASAWFRGSGRAAATSTYGLTILFAFYTNQWPMVRPDSLVSLFAIALIVCAGLGLTRGGAGYWFGAGLAASCGAFTHLIASSLVASSIVLFVVAATRRWLEADNRPQRQRQLLTSLFAFACGGLLGAVMFYAAFGFRFSDQLRLFTAYRALVASTDSYSTVVARHLFVAFRYLSPRWLIYVTSVIVAGWALVASARLLSRDSRTLVYGVLLPPITVWTGYIISNGWYTNQHKGYSILHEVMIAWVLASIVWIAVTLASRRRSRLARAVPVLVGILLVAQGVRQIEWQLEAAVPRAAAVSRSVSIDDYIAHVLGHVPAQSTAWGSVMYGIQTPDRLQLVQVSEGVELMPRVDEHRRVELAPDYLLWGYPEMRDTAISVLRGGESLLGKVALSTMDSRYRVVSLVSAPPYGVTRVYARADATDRTPPLPDVSIFDPDSQRWVSRIARSVPAVFAAAAPATFAIGYGADPRPAAAARTVSAVLPSGRYLIRVGLTPGAGNTTHRLLVATSPEQRRQQVGDLGPEGDFASYLPHDRQVAMLAIHEGGPLDISQFDDGAGAGLGSIDVFAVDPPLEVDEVPNIHLLPPPDSWTPSTGVRTIAAAGGGLAVDGDATMDGYQLVSPKIAPDAGDRDRVMLHLDINVIQGRACVGVLNGTKTVWLVSPTQPHADVTFVKDDTRGFYVVSANCNPTGVGNVATRLSMSGGRYTIEPAALYTDRLMGALDRGAPTDADKLAEVPGLVTAPPLLPVTGRLLGAPARPITSADMAFQAAIVKASGEGWTIAGRADSAYSYLFQSKPRSLDRDSRLIVTGIVERGGVTFGLLIRNEWAVQVKVAEPGPFTVVIAPPKNSPYSIVAANFLEGSLDTSIRISKLAVTHAP